MFIQDQVSMDQLDTGHLGFFRAIGVDSIHLDLRGGVANAADTSLAQDLRAGKDCTGELARAREKVEAHGLKLNNIFMPAWEEDHPRPGKTWTRRSATGAGWWRAWAAPASPA